MKKLFMIAVVVCLASCAGKEKKDGGGDMAKSAWSDTDQKAFSENCVSAAANGMDSVTAKSYCDCMLNKMMDKYAVADSAMNMTMDDMMTMAQGCIK